MPFIPPNYPGACWCQNLSGWWYPGVLWFPPRNQARLYFLFWLSCDLTPSNCFPPIEGITFAAHYVVQNLLNCLQITNLLLLSFFGAFLMLCWVCFVSVFLTSSGVGYSRRPTLRLCHAESFGEGTLEHWKDHRLFPHFIGPPRRSI